MEEHKQHKKKKTNAKELKTKTKTQLEERQQYLRSDTEYQSAWEPSL